MARIDRLTRTHRGSAPVVPILPVHTRADYERREDEEADREEARRARTRHPRPPAPPPDSSPHVDVRA